MPGPPYRPWLCCALVLLSACVRGCGRSDGTRSKATPEGAAGAAAADAAEGQLFSGEVLGFSLTLDAAAMHSLAREPRKWVEGELAFGDQRLPRVGVRFKGHRSLRKWSSKPAFKLDFSKHEKGRTFLGQKTLVLNNMVEDPTMVREALGFAVFRALGAPAPRTGYAELSINGERFGLYAILETPEKAFLSRHFGSSEGALYEGEYGCDVLPDQAMALSLEDGKDPERKLISALAAAAQGPIMDVLEGDGALIDGQRFFAFLAAGAWVADFDGFRHAHNYRVYYDPAKERWSFMPWGLDRVFDRDMSVFDNHELLATKCFADKACRLRYVQTLHGALPRIEALGLPAQLERIDQRIAKVVARDKRRPHDDDARAKRLEKTRAWLEGRSARVREQIACWDGKTERDADGDGFGCSDCDDQDKNVHPAAPEQCDGRDEDCSGVADDAPACPCPEQTIEGVRFALCDRPVPWERAAELCEGQGGVLAYFDGKEQSRAVGKAALAARNEDWWIGLNDREREGKRQWQGGVKESFRDWSSGEPDDYACAEDCVAIEEDENGRWHDAPCAASRPFVCRLP